MKRSFFQAAVTSILQDDQLERTFSSYVRIQVVVLKTYLGRWTIGRSGERGSGISVLPARYDDDDDDMLEVIVPSFLCVWKWMPCRRIRKVLQSRDSFLVGEGGPCSVMVTANHCGIVVSEFVLQSRHYVHFWANTLVIVMNPLILPAMR